MLFIKGKVFYHSLLPILPPIIYLLHTHTYTHWFWEWEEDEEGNERNLDTDGSLRSYPVLQATLSWVVNQWERESPNTGGA